VPSLAKLKSNVGEDAQLRTSPSLTETKLGSKMPAKLRRAPAKRGERGSVKAVTSTQKPKTLLAFESFALGSMLLEERKEGRSSLPAAAESVAN
jgi:hypothetical protein